MIQLQATEETKAHHRDFLALLARIQQPSTIVRRDVGRAVRRGIAENFVRERAGDGPAWAPLAPLTIRTRIRRGFGAGPKLFNTGRLLRSYTEEFDRDHDQRFRSTATGYEMEYGSTDYRAAWHEGGTSRMPARPVLFLSSRSETDLSYSLANVHTRIFASAGF